MDSEFRANDDFVMPTLSDGGNSSGEVREGAAEARRTCPVGVVPWVWSGRQYSVLRAGYLLLRGTYLTYSSNHPAKRYML